MTEALFSNESTPDASASIRNAPEALQLLHLDSIVGYGNRIAEQFEQEDDQSDYREYRNQRIDELLSENGIVDGDEEATHAEYLLARSIYEQVIDYDEDDWLTREEGGEVQRRNNIFRRILAAYPLNSEVSPSADDSQTEEIEQDESAIASENEINDAAVIPTEPVHNDDIEVRRASIDDLESQLIELRDRMAAITAKRQDKFFSRNSQKRDQLQTQYYEVVQELGRRHLALHEDETDEMKNVIAMTVIFDEQEKLREKTLAELEGKPLGKFIKWMNRGSVAVRVAKGLTLGAVAGLGGSLLAGGIGAGVLAGGAVAVSRFARNFALKDNMTRGMASIYDGYEVEDGQAIKSKDTKSSAINADADLLNQTENLNFTDDDDRMRRVQEVTGANAAFETDTKNEQNKRLKSALFGTAMIGAGAFAGYGVHKAAELVSNSDLDLIRVVSDKWDEFWNDGVKSGVSNNNLTPNTDTSDIAPDNPNMPNDPGTVDADKNWADFDHRARFVEPGEGGFQTLKEMGIPEHKWESIWQDAGAELNDNGKTYLMDDGHWGWSDDMRLTDKDLSILAKAAERNGVNL